MFDIADRLDNKPESHGRRLRTAIILFLTLSAQTSGLSWATEGQQYRADEWITECDPGPSTSAADCSITVPFWETRGDPSGSFALVVMLQTGNIGIVGQPFPVRAVLRVDKNPDRVQTAALLHVFEFPSTRCPEAIQGRITHFDRCVYGQGSL